MPEGDDGEMKLLEKIRQKLKESGKTLWIYATVDPNSPKGLRRRATILAKTGLVLEHPSISILVKQALLLENKADLIPDPKVWENMTGKDKNDWVQSHLEGSL